MKKPQSGCCQAEIITKGSSWKRDRCSECDGYIAYGLHSHKWATLESSAVFEDFSGDWWFAWQQVQTWESVSEMIDSGRHTFVCQVANVISSIGGQYNTQDTDFIERRFHKRFLLDYVDKVQNPEVAKLLQ